MSSIDNTPLMNASVSTSAVPRRRTARGFSRRRLQYSRNTDRLLQPFLLIEAKTFLSQWGYRDNGNIDLLSDLVAFDGLRRLISKSEFKDIVNNLVAERQTPYGFVFYHTIRIYPAFQLLFVRRESTGQRDTLQGLLPADAIVLCGTPIKHPLYDEFPLEIIPFAQLSRVPAQSSSDMEITKEKLSELAPELSGMTRYQKVLQILAPVLALSGTVDASDYNMCINQTDMSTNTETRMSSSNVETVGGEADTINNNQINEAQTTRYLSVNFETHRPVSNDNQRDLTVVRRRHINIRYTPHDLNSHRSVLPTETTSNVSDSESTLQGDRRRVRVDRDRQLVRQIQSELCELTAMQSLEAITELHDFTKMLKETLERSVFSGQ